MIRNPLRRFNRRVALVGMRPPLHVYRPSRTDLDLTGKRVLLTGASSGIGEAAAEKFARCGAIVVMVARRQELLDAVVARIAADNGEAQAISCDLSDLDAVDDLVAEVENRLGGVDILVNNAARSIRRPLAESLDRWHDAERTMTLNYYAALRLIRGIAPGMLKRGDGHIINVSTAFLSTESAPLFAVYHASKAAMSVVSRVIETEWGGQGIHSTTLYYPLVSTAMISPTREYDGLITLTAAEAAEWMIVAARKRPVRIAPRVALTASVADTVAPRLMNALIKRLEGAARRLY